MMIQGVSKNAQTISLYEYLFPPLFFENTVARGDIPTLVDNFYEYLDISLAPLRDSTTVIVSIKFPTNLKMYMHRSCKIFSANIYFLPQTI